MELPDVSDQNGNGVDDDLEGFKIDPPFRSGTASLRGRQALFDSTLNSFAANVAIGVGQSSGINVQRSILIQCHEYEA